MKKLLIIFGIVILLTGCDAMINLNLKNDFSYDSDLTVKNFEEYCVINDFEQYMNINYKSNDILYTKINAFNEQYSLKATKSGNSIENLDSEKILINNFGKLTVDKENKKIYFTTDKTKCLGVMYQGESENSTEESSKISINVFFPFKIIEHNANYEINNVYTWEITVNDCGTELYAFYEKKDYSKIVTFLGIFLAVLILFLTLRAKYKKINKI